MTVELNGKRQYNRTNSIKNLFLINILFGEIRLDDVFYDIGENIETVLHKLMYKMVEGEVVEFKPLSANIEKLTKSSVLWD